MIVTLPFSKLNELNEDIYKSVVIVGKRSKQIIDDRQINRIDVFEEEEDFASLDSVREIEIEQYESVMRQSRKVLTRMDEVLDNCTNITPEETSDWKEFWKNLKESSFKKPE